MSLKHKRQAQARADRRKGFRPQLQQLEDRCTPSCTVVQQGNTLFITGDRQANQVVVMDEERGVRLVCDGVERSFTGVEIVATNLGAGNDFWSWGEGPSPNIRLVETNLGSGDDTAVIAIVNTAFEGLNIEVNGGDGSDTIDYQVENVQGMLTLGGNGDAGADTIGYLGVGLIGSLDIVVDGGDGPDALSLRPHKHVGMVNAMMVGAAGNDTIVEHSQGFQGTLNLTAAGGGGDDSISQYAEDFQGTQVLVLAGGFGNDIMRQESEDLLGSQRCFIAGDAGDDVIAIAEASEQMAPPVDPNLADFHWGVMGGDGNDEVSFMEKSLRSGLMLDVIADLGGGNDSFGATFIPVDQFIPAPEDAPPADVHLKVLGQDGNDTMSLSQFALGSVNESISMALGSGDDSMAVFIPTEQFGPPPPDDPVSMFDLDAFGGEGTDTLQFELSPSATNPSNDKFCVHLMGGGGMDTLDVSVSGPGTGPPSHLLGEVELNVNGGDGDDHAVIAIVNVALEGSLAANMDMGAGSDTVEWVFEDVAIDVDGSGTNRTIGSAGNDTVNWTFQDVTINGSLTAEASGGDGADQLSLAYQWQIAAGGRAEVNLFGDDGPDTIVVLNRNHIAAGGTFVKRIDGGAGDDNINFTYYGAQIDGSALVHLMGSAGNDTLTMHLDGLAIGGRLDTYMDGALGDDVENFLAEDHRITGTLTTDLDGGFGNDTLNLAVLACDIIGTLHAAASGGDGNDNMRIMIAEDHCPGTVSLQLDTGGGDDSASVFCANNLFEALELGMDTGAGNDVVNLETTHVQFGSASLAAHLGAGNDVARWTNQGTITGRSLLANFDGGAGADMIFADLDPMVLAGAEYLVRLDGGANDDVVVANLHIAPESQGPIQAEILGSDGNDLLGLLVSGIENPDTFQGLVDGGDGYDIAIVSRAALILTPNCEEVIYV